MNILKRFLLLVCVCGFGASMAAAQTAPAAKPVAREPSKSLDQKIERLRTEDAGARIDELRVGGQTISIEVQPAANVPAYQVNPLSGGSAGPAQRDAPASAQGARTWKILSF
jgi:hypothetical protein